MNYDPVQVAQNIYHSSLNFLMLHSREQYKGKILATKKYNLNLFVSSVTRLYKLQGKLP